MGVHGLWDLLSVSAGRVPLDALEGRVLAVDASLFLSQVLKGSAKTNVAERDVTRVYLVYVFYRLCKLLYHGIKPIFVFDGATPLLKTETIRRRRAAQKDMSKKIARLARKVLLSELAGRELGERPAEAAAKKARTAHRDSDILLDDPGVTFEMEERRLAALAVSKNVRSVDARSDISDLGQEDDEGSFEDDSFAGITIDNVDFTTLPHLPDRFRLRLLEKLRKERFGWFRRDWGQHSDQMEDFSKGQISRFLRASKVSFEIERTRAIMTDPFHGQAGIGAGYMSSVASDQGLRYLIVRRQMEKHRPESHQSTAPHPVSDVVEVAVCADDELTTERAAEVSAHVASVCDNDEEVRSVEIISAIHAAASSTVSSGFESSPSDGASGTFVAETIQPGEMYISPEFLSMSQEADDAEAFGADDPVFDGIPLCGNQNRLGMTPLQTAHLWEKIPDPAFPVADVVAGQASTSGVLVRSMSPLVLVDDDPRQEEQKADISDCRSVVTELSSIEEGPELQEALICSLNDERGALVSANNASTTVVDYSSAPKRFVAAAHVSKRDEKRPLPSPERSSNSFGTGELLERNGSSAGELEETGDQEVLAEVEKFDIGDAGSCLFGVSDAIVRLDSAGCGAEVPGTDVPVSALFDSHVPSEEAIDWVSSEQVGDDAEAFAEFLEDIDFGSLQNMDLSCALSKLQACREKWRSEMGDLIAHSARLTDEVVYACQEMLQYFGVPYIRAPQEADSQCAFLNRSGLCDGIISEDSDMFVFGAVRVYRRFFAAARDVEEYDLADIETLLGLSSEKLVSLAMLLGSDYTDGVHNVGIVTAMEIVAAFPTYEDLTLFRQWLDLLLTSTPADELIRRFTPAQKDFCSRFASMAKRFTVEDPLFPSKTVHDAYRRPAVDSSLDPFSWLDPDPELLIAYAKQTFGWSPERTAKYIRPMIAKARARKRQLRSTLQSFVVPHREVRKDRVAIVRSQRLAQAIRVLTGSSSVGVPSSPGLASSSASS